MTLNPFSLRSRLTVTQERLRAAELEIQEQRDTVKDVKAVADDVLDWYCLDHITNGQAFSQDVVEDWRAKIREAGQ